MGGEGGMEEELVKRAGIPFQSIPAAGIHGVGWRALPGNLAKLSRGVRAAGRILKDYQPEAILLTGGYLAMPMALAGRSMPTLLYVPDIEPGMAVKAAAPFADRIAVTASDSRTYYRARQKVVVTGYPVRSELTQWKREDGREVLGLTGELPVILVTGGSRGAHSINRAVLENLPGLLEMAQVVHLCGRLDQPEVEAAAGRLPADLGERYHPIPYLHEMGAALASADLVVSRAGASVLGEYPYFELPAILVPYPYAWRYQRVNAGVLARHRAALILEDRFLQQELYPLITDLLRNPAKLAAMRAAMGALRQPEAAAAIAEVLAQLAEPRSSNG